MQQFNVVISGFDHYDDVDINPSYEVPKILAEQKMDMSTDADDPLSDVSVTVHAVSLPISFNESWPMLRDSLEAIHPDIVVATGMKHYARGIALERCAMNLMDMVDSGQVSADTIDEHPQRKPIDPSGPAAYWTRLPLHSILSAFADDGIPAILSSDAGTYVCNSLFYQLLDWTRSQNRVLAGFISFPQVSDTPRAQQGLTLDQQITACRDVVREAIRYHLSPSSQEILLA